MREKVWDISETQRGYNADTQTIRYKRSRRDTRHPVTTLLDRPQLILLCFNPQKPALQEFPPPCISSVVPFVALAPNAFSKHHV